MFWQIYSKPLSPARAIWCIESPTIIQQNTFWAFFSQVLDADGGCPDVIRKLQAFAAMRSKPLPSSSTAAYCQARKRLDLATLKAIFLHTVQQLQDQGVGY